MAREKVPGAQAPNCLSPPTNPATPIRSESNRDGAKPVTFDNQCAAYESTYNLAGWESRSQPGVATGIGAGQRKCADAVIRRVIDQNALSSTVGVDHSGRSRAGRDPRRLPRLFMVR